MEKEAAFYQVNNAYQKANERCFIYPTEAKKYTGSILASKWGTYIVKINHQSLKQVINKNFKTYAEAFEFVKDMNKRLKLPIRNMIRDHGIYMTARMTQGQKMIFDHRKIALVQKHCIFPCNHKNGTAIYAKTKIFNEDKQVLQSVAFHNLLVPIASADPSITIDHINIRSNDNREVNLRPATTHLQATNKRLYKNNTTGKTGVKYRQSRNVFEAAYSEFGKVHCKSFSISKYGYAQAEQMAKEYREKMENITPIYIEAYCKDKVGINMAENDMYDVTEDLKRRHSAIELK